LIGCWLAHDQSLHRVSDKFSCHSVASLKGLAKIRAARDSEFITVFAGIDLDRNQTDYPQSRKKSIYRPVLKPSFANSNVGRHLLDLEVEQLGIRHAYSGLDSPMRRC